MAYNCDINSNYRESAPIYYQYVPSNSYQLYNDNEYAPTICDTVCDARTCNWLQYYSIAYQNQMRKLKNREITMEYWVRQLQYFRNLLKNFVSEIENPEELKKLLTTCDCRSKECFVKRCKPCPVPNRCCAPPCQENPLIRLCNALNIPCPNIPCNSCNSCRCASSCCTAPCRKCSCQSVPCEGDPCSNTPCSNTPCSNTPCSVRPCSVRTCCYTNSSCQTKPCVQRPCPKSTNACQIPKCKCGRKKRKCCNCFDSSGSCGCCKNCINLYKSNFKIVLKKINNILSTVEQIKDCNCNLPVQDCCSIIPENDPPPKNVCKCGEYENKCPKKDKIYGCKCFKKPKKPKKILLCKCCDTSDYKKKEKKMLCKCCGTSSDYKNKEKKILCKCCANKDLQDIPEMCNNEDNDDESTLETHECHHNTPEYSTTKTRNIRKSSESTTEVDGKILKKLSEYTQYYTIESSKSNIETDTPTSESRDSSYEMDEGCTSQLGELENVDCLQKHASVLIGEDYISSSGQFEVMIQDQDQNSNRSKLVFEVNYLSYNKPKSDDHL